jgi:hypothetical protein
MEAAGMSFTLYYEEALTIEAVNKELFHYQYTYNHYRPHDSLI